MKTKASIQIDEEILQKANEMGINVSKACENALIILTDHSAKANAWFGRQTHNLENKTGQTPNCPEVAGSNPAPGTILPVKACFLAILDKEVLFGR